jgi:hypothetical protein
LGLELLDGLVVTMQSQICTHLVPGLGIFEVVVAPVQDVRPTPARIQLVAEVVVEVLHEFLIRCQRGVALVVVVPDVLS